LRTGKVTALITIFLIVSTSSALGVTKRSRTLRTKHHRLARHINWNPLIRGSHESMLRQNEEIDRLGLPRIEDEGQLDELKTNLELVELSDTKTMRVDPRLDPSLRFCKSWTRDFVDDISSAYYEQFKTKIQVNSAVRTVEHQKQLRRHNRNAAPETGETASSHLAGLTVDISKRGMTKKQHKWFENYLANLRDHNLIEAAEERRQAVFHIMVSERYADWRAENILAKEEKTAD
jgi:hypothetical protein